MIGERRSRDHIAVAGCTCLPIALGTLVVVHPTWAIAVLGGFGAGLLPVWLLLGLVIPVRIIANDGLFELLGGPVTPTDLLVVALIFRQGLALLHDGRPRLNRNAWFLIGFVAWAWLATFHAGASGTALVRVTAYALLALTYTLGRTDERRLHLSITVASFVSMASALPYLASGLVEAQDRIGDPHQLGFLMIAGATPLLAREVGGRWAPVLAVPLLLTAIATFRRGIWFALIIVVVLVIAPRLSVRRLLVVTAGLTIAGLVLFAPLSRVFGLQQRSYDYRKETIERGLDAAGRDPIFGTGWAALVTDPDSELGAGGVDVSPVVLDRQPASLPVSILASAGVIGLVLFAAFFYSMMRVLARRSRSSFLLGGAFLALSVFGLTIGADSRVTMLFFILVAAPAIRNPADSSSTSEDRERRRKLILEPS